MAFLSKEVSMLWDLLQQTQISSAQRSANEASLKASITEINILELQGQVQTLALASQAMWELLSHQFGITETDLLNKMSEIDMRDGVADGKVSVKSLSKCPDCGKDVKKIRPNCYWCGAKLSLAMPFIK
jgi:hypothetical protein